MVATRTKKKTDSPIKEVFYPPPVEGKAVFCRWAGSEWEAYFLDTGEKDPFSDVLEKIQIGEYEILIKRLPSSK